MSDALADDLERFRLEWIEETRRTKGSTARSEAATNGESRDERVTSPQSAVTPRSPPRPGPPALVKDETTSPKSSKREKSALEVYSEAVRAERQGKMNEALFGYRQAFKMDNDIDKLYHKVSMSQPAKSATGASTTNGSGAQQSDAFHFERTVQLAPDYEAHKERRSKESVIQATTASTKTTDDLTHPSSTTYLLNSLAKSFAENPFTTDDAEPADVPELTPQQAIDAARFEPEDESRPVPIARLPRELLLLILKFVALSSIHPPPVAHTPAPAAAPEDAATTKTATKKHHHRKQRTLRDETRLLEIEADIAPDLEREWRTDVEALERFARVSRYARLVTLDDSLWRSLCRRTYFAPQIDADTDALSLQRSLHGSDWRRMYIEHPRIRLDGTFIAVVTYLRRGDSSASPSSSSSSWTAPSHLITFYRYLRFYASGLVLSLLTTDEPSAIVRSLNPALRAKGLTVGRWSLDTGSSSGSGIGNATVTCDSLEDPSVEPQDRKYAFRMTLRLRSTTRGKMNKLDMVSLATENKRTGEVEEVPIRPTKPFFFSKVAAYAAEDVD